MINMRGVASRFADTDIIIKQKIGGGGFERGEYQGAQYKDVPRRVSLQGAKPDEVQMIAGGERLTDVRRFYLNDGTDVSAYRGDMVETPEGTYKVMFVDPRPKKNYLKVIIARLDPKRGDHA